MPGDSNASRTAGPLLEHVVETIADGEPCQNSNMTVWGNGIETIHATCKFFI